MPNPPLSAITPGHWMVVGGAGLLMSLNVLMFLAVGLLLPPLATSLGVGLSQVMLFVSINMVAGALTLAIVGPFLIRRLGSRRLALMTGPRLWRGAPPERTCWRAEPPTRVPSLVAQRPGA